MDDDFNTGGAIAELFDMLRELNKFADQRRTWNSLATTLRTRRSSRIRCADTREGNASSLRELTAILGVFKTRCSRSALSRRVSVARK